MQSWNTIKRSLKEFSQEHPLVNSFGTGNLLDPDSAQITNFITSGVDRVYYPLVFAVLDGARFATNSIEFSVSLVFMDKIEEAQKVADMPTIGNPVRFQQMQPDEVMSDMTQLAGDFMIKYQRTFANNFDISSDANVEYFNDRFGDRVAGCRATMSFNVPLQLSICSIPSDTPTDTVYFGAVEDIALIPYFEGNTQSNVPESALNIVFDSEATDNKFIWFGVPNSYYFATWFRSSFDQGPFDDLFYIIDSIDGYDFYVSNWQTNATINMTIA
jgi:hypothetical protein